MEVEEGASSRQSAWWFFDLVPRNTRPTRGTIWDPFTASTEISCIMLPPCENSGSSSHGSQFIFSGLSFFIFLLIPHTFLTFHLCSQLYYVLLHLSPAEALATKIPFAVTRKMTMVSGSFKKWLGTVFCLSPLRFVSLWCFWDDCCIFDRGRSSDDHRQIVTFARFCHRHAPRHTLYTRKREPLDTAVQIDDGMTKFLHLTTRNWSNSQSSFLRCIDHRDIVSFGGWWRIFCSFISLFVATLVLGWRAFSLIGLGLVAFVIFRTVAGAN